MDPELLAKLTRRRRVIEGDVKEEEANEEEASRASASSVRTTPGRLPPQLTSPQSAGSGDTEPMREPAPERRRVRVPAWIRPTTARPLVPMQPHQRQPWQGGCSRGAAAHAEPRPSSTAERVSEMLARLRAAEMERDAARREATSTEAGVAQRCADLECDAGRLRAQAEELREQLRLARQEVALLQGVDIAATGSRAHAPFLRQTSDAEDEDLYLQLREQAEAQRNLTTRMQGLQTELRHQVDSCAGLQERLMASRARREENGKRLEARSRRMAEEAAERAAAAGGARGQQASAAEASWQRLALPDTPRVDAPDAASVPSPSNAQFFQLHQDNDEDGHSPLKATPRKEGHDLEFAYDWGLGLAGKMSVARALKLAEWAAARGRNADGGDRLEDATTAEGGAASSAAASFSLEAEGLAEAGGDAVDDAVDDEGRFAEPLAELQGALATLTSARRVRGTSEFDAPVAELEKALALLGAGALEPDLSEDPAPAKSASVEDADDGGGVEGGAFSGALSDLQDVLARLGGERAATAREDAAAAPPPAPPPPPQAAEAVAEAPPPPPPAEPPTATPELARPLPPQPGVALLGGLFTMPLSAAQDLVRRKYGGGFLTAVP